MIGRPLQVKSSASRIKSSGSRSSGGAGCENHTGEVARVTECSSHLREGVRTRVAADANVRVAAMSETNLKRAGNTLEVKPVQRRSNTLIWRARERGSEQE